MKIIQSILKTDLLIVGGGAAGCFAAISASEKSKLKILIAEKSNIKRSGCLAAGVNALNAYIGKGETPESFTNYVKREFSEVVREDLIYNAAKRLNHVTEAVEKMGLTILKDEDGNYVQRGKRSIKINGENIKPILVKELKSKDNVEILNGVNIVDYIVKNEKVIGAIGFSVKEPKIYIIYAKAVICTTGGASGIYKPNNPGFSRHKMWYSPFNTGAGYAMGIRAGAEMTTFEMRFIALRCKDTIAPTGTIAQGVKTPQVNSLGEEYVHKYGKPTTVNRLYSTVMENLSGNGPCYLKTEGINENQVEDLTKAYLNMAPSQALKWFDRKIDPALSNIEIEGTEPYIVGGHGASGYWVDTKRKTTIEGLYAAGDVSGGSPKKYVTGCFAEGEIAAENAVEYAEKQQLNTVTEEEIGEIVHTITGFFNGESDFNFEELEEAMQKTMDEYAGGISQHYGYTEKKLNIAEERIEELLKLSYTLKAKDMHELLFIFELIDRLYVARVVIAHLKARRETRWKCYEQNESYKAKDDDNFLRYVNSVCRAGKINIVYRKLIGRDEIYEH